MKFAGAFATVAIAEAGSLAVTWDDCGAQHATVTELQPATISTGTTATVTGSGDLDEAVTSAHFSATVKAAGVKLTSCEGDATTDIECKLPLGAGTIVVKAVPFPLAAGKVDIPVDVTTSSLIPASLAKVDVEIRATEQNGEDVICLNVHTAKQELETAAAGAHWAVLVAGSNSYSNYRHQADVCHAYQVVKSHGIPEDHIIVMAYDDIANNSRNPFPGQMFNKPTASGVAGTDVYAGCKIDYSGSDVTPENFQKVLTGTASGKSLQSTADDNVFVFFSDHGAAGLIAFPSSQMHKADLQSTFETMHSKNMYNKLTFYLETCESGSMFEGMTTPGVYALSASSPSESSWGTYCGSDAMVNGKSIGSCLGDLFSVSWMEDSDVADLTSESLGEQATVVAQKTSKSKVMPWGDLTFQDDKVSEYQSGPAANAARGEASEDPAARSAMSAREVDLKQAYFNYVHATEGEERIAAGEDLSAVLKDQMAVEAAYERFLSIVYPDDAAKVTAAREGNAPANQRDCELAARESFVTNGDFDSFTGYSLQFHKYVVNVCADVAASGMNVDVAEAAKQACLGSVLV